MPEVSWLMPVLNGAKYIEEALSSIASQTFRDFEVLVLDNGSTDGTLELLGKWIPTRLPGRVIKGDRLSVGRSLAYLVKVSTSPLCARLDADDASLPHRLERQVEFLDRYSDVGLVGSGRRVVDLNGDTLPDAKELPVNHSDVLHESIVGSALCHPSVLFRREVVLKAGNYQDHATEDCPFWWEDYDLWMRLHSVSRIAVLPEKLVKYRVNPEGVSQTVIRNKQAALARARAFERNAHVFMGIDDPLTASELCRRMLRFALPSFFQIARKFSEYDGITVPQRFRTVSFLNAVLKLTGPTDYATLLFLKLCRLLPSVSRKKTSLNSPWDLIN